MKFPELTRPAIIASIAYMIMAFMILLPFPVKSTPLDDDRRPSRYHFGYRLLVLVIMLIPIGLSIYSINCMMMGRCVVWSYVQAVAIALWVMLFVIATLLSSEKEPVVIVK